MNYISKPEYNFNLAPYNTFKIESKAKTVFLPSGIEEFTELLINIENPFILGSGSNVLLSSTGVNQPVILTKFLDKIALEDDIITAQTGVKTPILAKFALENSLTGFEFLTSIPATVGGAVCMNASAHAQAVSDTFLCAKLFDLKTKKIIEFSKEEMLFDYRTSILKSGGYVLLNAKFKPEHGIKTDIRAKMDENIALRKKHQPDLRLPNAGSVFKNPENDFAGNLIDKTGLKGQKIGGAQIYENHANFIINKDNATSKDVCELMFLAYNKVKEKFGIELEPEILFVGEKTKRESEIWDIISKKPNV